MCGKLNAVEGKIVNNMILSNKLIRESGIKFIEYGYFGSVARGTYNATSDLDIAMIVSELPSRKEMADLRCNLEAVGCDLVILLDSSFSNPDSVFKNNVVRDYVRVGVYGE